ncbi:MAG: EAL domain-containing protein [Nitrospirota bacterium]
MKRILFLFLFITAAVFSIGTIVSIVLIQNTVDTLHKLTYYHQNSSFRNDMKGSIHALQQLQFRSNAMKTDPASVSKTVARLHNSTRTCMTCHHTEETTRALNRMEEKITEYEKEFISYTNRLGNFSHDNLQKQNMRALQQELLTLADTVSDSAEMQSGAMVLTAGRSIMKTWIAFSLGMMILLVAAGILAARLIASIRRHLAVLLNAHMMIAWGNSGYTIPAQDKIEFGELAKSFNDMSASLEGNQAKLEHALAGQKRAEALLWKTELFLGGMFASIQEPLCILDRSLKIVRANAAYAESMHATEESFIGQSCHEIHQQCSTACDDCLVQKTFASGIPLVEKQERMSAGKKTWKEITTYPLKDGSGSIQYVVYRSHDVTSQKTIKDELAQREERSALAIEGTRDGLWDWDIAGKQLYVSERWKSMLGYSDSEIRNTPEEWLNRVHPDDRPELESKIAAYLQGVVHTHLKAEYRLLHKDGTYRWMLTRGIALRNPDGSAYRVTGLQTDISVRKKVEEQLLHDAFHDDLTGLPNRALFMDRLEHVIMTSLRTEFLYAVLFLDLDGFKIINDTYGHTTGDYLLAAVGRQLSACVRPGDTVARIGGDEFAVLLENINALQDAIEVAERIHKKLADPIRIQGNDVSVSFSIGIAPGCAQYMRAEQVLRDADIAMYQSKAKGSARYEVFHLDMHSDVLDRQQLEEDLRRALERRELALCYHPIIDLKTRMISGFEALLRWNHPERGVLSPQEFLYLAEDTGMIHDIGKWILEESCRKIQILQEKHPMTPPLTLNVNFTAKQFLQADLVSTVMDIIQETGVDPRTLVFEITESMLMKNVDVMISVMNRLRSMGIRICLDDFGTGYSSLSYLHQFPIHALKIDRTCIEKLSERGENQEVILSILSLAKSLHFDVIAEGLEHAYQLSTVKDLHCRYGQGFLFTPPLGFQEIDSWMKKDHSWN